MPAWSPEIANEFIKLASQHRRPLNQLVLQRLVYLAHGWCLAIHDAPLTGDRPEAWTSGPVYRRLAEALAAQDRRPVASEIELESPSLENGPELDHSQKDIILKVYHSYEHFSETRLSDLAVREPSPWGAVFDGGKGKFRDIPHNLIRAQFLEIAARLSEDSRDD